MTPEPTPAGADASSLWDRWKEIAARAATFQARVLLTLFYWTVIPVFALFLRLLSDPLGLSRKNGGRWTAAGRVDPWTQH